MNLSAMSDHLIGFIHTINISYHKRYKALLLNITSSEFDSFAGLLSTCIPFSSATLCNPYLIVMAVHAT